jgi:hypothetical protein
MRDRTWAHGGCQALWRRAGGGPVRVGKRLSGTGPECGDCSLHSRVDVGVVEINQCAVFLEGGQEPGIGSGDGEHTAVGMKGVDESGEGEAGGVVDIVQ